MVVFPLVGCGSDDASPRTDEASPVAAGDESSGVVVTGDGWEATFPGEVEKVSDPIPLPGGLGSTTAESATWESSSEAVNVVTSDFPSDVIDMIDTSMLLEGTAAGIDGTLIDGSAVLDADGTFRGRDAVVYEARQDGLVTTGLAFVDGARLYQVLHVSRGGDLSTWRALVDSFDFT